MQNRVHRRLSPATLQHCNFSHRMKFASLSLVHAQQKPQAAQLSPQAKRNQTMWITSDVNYFVDAKSHAREKPQVAGYQNIPYDLTKDIFGIIKWKSPLDRHSKGKKGFIGKTHHFPLLFNWCIPVELTGSHEFRSLMMLYEVMHHGM